MTSLKKGDKAPAFIGKSQNGKTISMENFAGKKLLLYFYPKDNTPGCTAESCNLRDNYALWQSKGYEVVGISPDSEKSHTGFSEKYNLPFPLIADTALEITKAYGAWGEKKMYGKSYQGLLRTTFVINSEGIIEEVITKVDTANHTAQLTKILSI